MSHDPNDQGPATSGPQANPFAQAQAILGRSTGQVKLIQYALLGVAGLLLLLAVVMLFSSGLFTALSMVFSAGITGYIALMVVPKYSAMLGDVGAQVDGWAQKAQLAQTGLPAQGRVLRVEQTGRLVNYNPEVEALLEVIHPSLGAYQVKTNAVVPQISIPSIQPGSTVNVRIDPQNAQEVALVF